MSEPQASTIVGAISGTAGLTFPLWSDAVAFATGASQLVVAFLGFVVLVLTIRKLWIEIKIANRRWNSEDRP